MRDTFYRSLNLTHGDENLYVHPRIPTIYAFNWYQFHPIKFAIH